MALTASPDLGKAVKNFHDFEFSFGDTLETNVTVKKVAVIKIFVGVCVFG